MPALKRDGVTLYYEEAGAGDPPILLVHGWCCDHTYFAPQFEHYSANHRTVAVDLRGHGASDKPEQQYSIDGFADDLAWLCDQLGLRKPVAIGHSLGGVIVLALATEHADLPAAIVMLDAPILPPPESAEAVQQMIGALWSPAYQDAIGGFVANVLFIPADDSARKAQVVEAMRSAPQHVMASCIEGLAGFDTYAAVRNLKLPALYIAAERPLGDVEKLKALNPNVLITQTAGVGHFHQLLVPDQVNAMIDRFLSITLGAAG